MIDRRALIAGIALVGTPLPTASAALARLVGIEDHPDVSQKFTGAGWYAFGPNDGGTMRIFYAEPDRAGYLPGFIDLSDSPGGRICASVSPQAFDFACWGQCFTADEADRRAGR